MMSQTNYASANRLTHVDGVGYTFDNNGNLLATGALTSTFDAANRLIETTRAGTTLQPSYDGLGNRVAQTVGLSTTTFALDVRGLPEVISTSAGNAYLHLPGVIVAENATGEVRYLLSDGLGSVRQAVDETGEVITYHEFDPYGNPLSTVSLLPSTPYGFTGEWWEDEVGLLYLRARWYLPETGTFLSPDVVEEEPSYSYGRGNPVNRVDPSGLLSRAVIERSLEGKQIPAAFATIDGRGRPGLYNLLLAAQNGDTVYALVVDFEQEPSGGRIPYPFTYDEEVTAIIDCRNGELIMLYGRLGRNRPQTWAGSKVWQSSLADYLQFLEEYEIRREYGGKGSTPWWRHETGRYHYYARNGDDYYDDFGLYTLLPDVIGFGGSIVHPTFSIGAGIESLYDRHGQAYISVAGITGYGPLPFSITYREGYLLHFNSSSGVRYDTALIKTPKELAKHLTEWGWDLGLSILAGVQLGSPLPALEPDIIWFSEGIDLGLSGSTGFVFGPDPDGGDTNRAWHWVDETSKGYDIKSLNSLNYEVTPENDCDCK